jgi:hypothetical protein
MTWAQGDTTKPQMLNPVVVTATQTYWTIDVWPMYDVMAHYYRYSDLVPVRYQVYTPDCAPASELYLAQQDTAAVMDSVAGMLNQITQATSNADAELSCKKTDNLPVCIDFFIMEKRSAVYGGDDRDFNPDAGYRQSRVQLYVDPLTGLFTAKYNSSTKLNLDGVVVERRDSTALWDPGRDVVISRSINGDTLRMQLRFYNNFCSSRDACPTIDATIWLIRDASQPGGYGVYWRRDGMPAMGVYSYDTANNSFVKMAEDPEKIRSPWFNWVALVGKFKQSIHMPPGCNLQ